MYNAADSNTTPLNGSSRDVYMLSDHEGDQNGTPSLAVIDNTQQRLADEEKEKMGVIDDLMLDINNLKLQRCRSSGNVREIHAELDKNALQFQKDQTQLKTEMKTLQLQCATQSTEPIRFAQEPVVSGNDCNY
ncbi:Hypothetical predicted protein [Mytilus galloprovincialis]|uniref:Uncharacterized protein n=1 Tax=Mytilus galloprovincialis TaxID=29158 RepID=A0A8B6E654_MYTGA|nr:Hypothetical predicted protein [Mytilus galloprovincialis]